MIKTLLILAIIIGAIGVYAYIVLLDIHERNWRKDTRKLPGD